MLPLLLALSRPAFPCAAIFVEEGGTASTDAQEALFEPGDGYVDTTWRVNGELDVSRLGWVIPAFGEVLEIADADPERFDGLRQATAPDVWIESTGSYEDDGGGGCGCGTALKGDAAGGERNALDTGAGQSLGVEVVAEGFTGTFMYTVLEATDSQDLLDWLDTNGFSVGPSGPSIDAYVAEAAADGGIQFVALRVDMGAASADRRELPAVRIRTSGDVMRFPSTMARNAAPERMNTRIYVLGDERAVVRGDWDSEQLGSRDGGTWTGDADSAYADVLYDIGGPRRTFAEIWSGPWDGRRLTRFDGIFDREAHIADVYLGDDGGTQSVQSELWFWDSGGSAERVADSGHAGLLLLPGGLLGLAALRRRRA